MKQLADVCCPDNIIHYFAGETRVYLCGVDSIFRIIIRFEFVVHRFSGTKKKEEEIQKHTVENI